MSLVAKVILGSILVLVIFGGSYGSFRIYNYTQHDPSFCRACHTMEVAWTKWENSEHSKVGCHSCHTVTPVGGAQLVLNYLMERPDRNTNHAHIPDQACEKCHYSGDPQWVQVEQTAGHKAHAEQQNIACQTCHGLRLHEFRPTTDICVACHFDHVEGQAKAIKVEQMQDLHCVECHEFLREDSPIRPTRLTCLGCHQDPANNRPGIVFPAGAPMSWDCRECHKPHDKANPVVDCIGCHTQAKSEGLHGASTHSQSRCIACHQPHKWTETTREPCLSCHTDKTEHMGGGNCIDCHTDSVGSKPGFSLPEGTGNKQPEDSEPSPGVTRTTDEGEASPE
jgi:hypothetical protein